MPSSDIRLVDPSTLARDTVAAVSLAEPNELLSRPEDATLSLNDERKPGGRGAPGVSFVGPGEGGWDSIASLCASGPCCSLPERVSYCWSAGFPGFCWVEFTNCPTLYRWSHYVIHSKYGRRAVRGLPCRESDVEQCHRRHDAPSSLPGIYNSAWACTVCESSHHPTAPIPNTSGLQGKSDKYFIPPFFLNTLCRWSILADT